MRKCERRRGGAFAGDNTVGQRLIVVERCEADMAEVEEGRLILHHVEHGVESGNLFAEDVDVVW